MGNLYKHNWHPFYIPLNVLFKNERGGALCSFESMADQAMVGHFSGWILNLVCEELFGLLFRIILSDNNFPNFTSHLVI